MGGGRGLSSKSLLKGPFFLQPSLMYFHGHAPGTVLSLDKMRFSTFSVLCFTSRLTVLSFTSRWTAEMECILGWTKIPKSFQNLMASWYILYQHGYRPFLQKKWFFLHFPHLATTLKKMPFLHSKNGAKIYKNRFLAIKSCRNML